MNDIQQQSQPLNFNVIQRLHCYSYSPNAHIFVKTAQVMYTNFSKIGVYK